MEDYLNDCILKALDAMGGAPEGFALVFEQPANPDHGDLSCNAAMQLARHFRKSPRMIAEDIANALQRIFQYISFIGCSFSKIFCKRLACSFCGIDQISHLLAHFKLCI